MTKDGARVSKTTTVGVIVALPPEEGESDAGDTGVEVPSETKGQDTRDVIEDDDATTADANQEERAEEAEALLAGPTPKKRGTTTTSPQSSSRGSKRATTPTTAAPGRSPMPTSSPP